MNTQGEVIKTVVTAVSPRALLLAGSATMTGLGLTTLQGWPLWGIALVGLIPWVPVFARQTVSLHDGWMGLFYVLVITQIGHLTEHVAQMAQIHWLHLHGAAARGIFGALDTEWVHLLWNVWVLAATAALLVHFRGNAWLWGALAIAGWHTAEHVYIMSIYLTSGGAGNPGFLARGGTFGGGLPVTRPDLHFIYNVVETLPIIIAFLVGSARTSPAVARPRPGPSYV